jgi:hypothetical protein
VNYAPTFTAGPSPITVEEDDNAFNATWATDLSAGPGDDENVTLSIKCDDAAEALFSKGRAISNDGVLTFTAASQMSGSSKCTVTLAEVGTDGKTAEASLVIIVKPGAGP